MEAIQELDSCDDGIWIIVVDPIENHTPDIKAETSDPCPGPSGSPAPPDYPVDVWVPDIKEECAQSQAPSGAGTHPTCDYPMLPSCTDSLEFLEHARTPVVQFPSRNDGGKRIDIKTKSADSCPGPSGSPAPPDHPVDVWVPDIKEECAQSQAASALGSHPTCDYPVLPSCSDSLEFLEHARTPVAQFPSRNNGGKRIDIKTKSADPGPGPSGSPAPPAPPDFPVDVLVPDIKEECTQSQMTSNAGSHLNCYNPMQPSCSDDSLEFVEHTRTPVAQFSRNNDGKRLHHPAGMLSDNDLLIRMRLHSSEKPFTCEECKKSYSEKQKLWRHLITHTGKKPFVCTECKKCFSEKGSLLKHLRTHTGEKPFACAKCKKCFSDKSGLSRHLKTYTGGRPYVCEECKKTFREKGQLLRHFRTHTGEKPFACEECKKTFNRKYSLLRHLRTHIGKKPFACDKCKKIFSVKRSLFRHLRTHTGEKPYVCEECKKSFSVKRSLLSHLRRHTGEKPFACEECKKSFSEKGSLLIHSRTHTGEKSFTCDECKKSFSVKGSLVIHLRTHTGEKPFTCDGCKKSFSVKGSLSSHLRTHKNLMCAKYVRKLSR